MKKNALFFVVALMLAGCAGADREVWRKASGGMWNTLYAVTYRSEHQLDDSIVATMHRVEMALSPFQPQSLISRINRGESDARADAMVRRVFAASKHVSELSGGMFDPTVAPLINYWGFGYASADSLSLDSVMARVGICDCDIAADGVVKKKHPATEFNFSAITKGYGCDAVGEMLRRNGCTDFLVEIGGEISASGASPRGGSWRVMVDAPTDCSDSIVHDGMLTLEIADCGVATSGNYRNYRLTEQGKVSHTINPRTGRPVTLDRSDTTVLSATVVAHTAMEADALATAAMLLPPHEAEMMIKRAGAFRLILALRTPTDSLTVRIWPRDE
ncbi:MAG: FAD:protein FMN transferase [Muribaculaceae bacterium]|nr:FAD:protein FMN transferase [Muribaculaceae bacterium]